MDNEKFTYTYTALSEEERINVQSLKNKYSEEKEVLSDLQRLKKLDAKIESASKITGLVFGIISCLIFGTGFAFILEFEFYYLGVLLSLVGLIGMIYTPFLSRKVRNNYKNRYKDEILSLANKLLQSDK